MYKKKKSGTGKVILTVIALVILLSSGYLLVADYERTREYGNYITGFIKGVFSLGADTDSDDEINRLSSKGLLAASVINNVNITPTPFYYRNLIRCKANITDADNDSLTVLFNVTSPEGVSYNSTGVADGNVWYSEFVTINETGRWDCNVTSDDGSAVSAGGVNFTPVYKIGAVSNTTGSLPFYSLTVNPLNVSSLSCMNELKSGQSCNQSWNVNATGYAGTEFLFYVIYNSSYADNLSAKINVTIIDNVTAILTTPIIDLSTAYTNDTFSCSFVMFDEDTNNLTANVTWHLNSTIGLNEMLNCTERETCYTINNVTPSLTSKLENWTCSVNAYDNTSWSGWKNSSGIIILNKEPDIPVLNSPVDGLYVDVNFSVINWTVTDIDLDAMDCYALAQNTTDPASVVNVTSGIINGSFSTYNWTGLNDTVYYWKVRCDDGSVNSSFSVIRNFTIDTTVPAIELILPINKSGDNDGNITFSYNVTETNYVDNCSLMVNNKVNITNVSISKNETNYFHLYDIPTVQYNWSINCSDNTGNVGDSDKRVMAVVLTTEYDYVTNLSSSNVFNVTDFFMRNVYGKFNFTNATDLSAGADLNKYSNISFNKIELNSTAVGVLNKSASLGLYNLNFGDPRILRNHVTCPSTVCSMDYYNISTARRNLTFNVTHFTIFSSEETPVPGPVIVTGGEGIGAGVGGPMKIVRKFEVDRDLLKIKLKQGETREEKLVITNGGDVKLNFSINVIGVEDLVLVMDDSFVLQPKESKEVTLYLSASDEQPVKLYTGKLLITAGYVVKVMGVIIDVTKKKPLFDVGVEVHNVTKKVLRGEYVEADITMINVGDLKKVDVTINYAIRDIDGNVINFREETMAVDGRLSVTRRLKLPEDVEYGNYLFHVELTYGKEKAVSTDVFEVVETKPVVEVKRYARISDFRDYMLFVLLIMISVILGIIGYKTGKESLSWFRYHKLEREAVSLSRRKFEVGRKFRQIRNLEQGLTIQRFNNLLMSVISDIKENRIDDDTIEKYNKMTMIYNDLRMSNIKREDKVRVYRRIANIRKALKKYAK